jgi:hypothetical protein
MKPAAAAAVLGSDDLIFPAVDTGMRRSSLAAERVCRARAALRPPARRVSADWATASSQARRRLGAEPEFPCLLEALQVGLPGSCPAVLDASIDITNAMLTHSCKLAPHSSPTCRPAAIASPAPVLSIILHRLAGGRLSGWG